MLAFLLLFSSVLFSFWRKGTLLVPFIAVEGAAIAVGAGAIVLAIFF